VDGWAVLAKRLGTYHGVTTLTPRAWPDRLAAVVAARWDLTVRQGDPRAVVVLREQR